MLAIGFHRFGLVNCSPRVRHPDQCVAVSMFNAAADLALQYAGASDIRRCDPKPFSFSFSFTSF
jgi:hypothetical protein